MSELSSQFSSWEEMLDFYTKKVEELKSKGKSSEDGYTLNICKCRIDEAKKEIKKARKQEFMKQRLPELFRQMQLLDITIEDIQKVWQQQS